MWQSLKSRFAAGQVQWRVTNTTTDKNRGQVRTLGRSASVTDRLSAVFSPQGRTPDYKVEIMSNITRMKKRESILSGRIRVTCAVTIFGLLSHCGTGEKWADDDNSTTSGDVQALERACSCFGLAATSMSLMSAIWPSGETCGSCESALRRVDARKPDEAFLPPSAGNPQFLSRLAFAAQTVATRLSPAKLMAFSLRKKSIDLHGVDCALLSACDTGWARLELGKEFSD